MKSLFAPLSLTLLVAGATAPGLQATVNPAIISADARWVIYADLNELRQTALGKELVTMAEEAQASSKAQIGVDVQKVFATIGSITAYGSNFTPDPKAIDGTLVLQGSPDLRKIAESLLLQATIASPATVAELTDLPFPAYTVKPKGPTPSAEALVAAFPPEGIILVSKSRAQLLKAYDAFRGTAPSIAKSATAPLHTMLKPGKSGYLVVASMVPPGTEFGEDSTQARILRMTNSGTITIGDTGENTVAHAELIASSNDMADKLMKILQGLTAMMSLTQSSDQQLSAFLASAVVERRDKVVTLQMSYSTERLAQMIRSLHDRQIRSPEQTAAVRAAQMLNGEALAQWKAEPAPATADDDKTGSPTRIATKTIDNVVLKNGSLLSLARQNKAVRFERVEITPTGGGSPLVFRREFMRTGGPRNAFQLLSFPGTDGTYTVKIVYTADREGKATYAVSVRHPEAPAPEPTTPPAAKN